MQLAMFYRRSYLLLNPVSVLEPDVRALTPVRVRIHRFRVLPVTGYLVRPRSPYIRMFLVQGILKMTNTRSSHGSYATKICVVLLSAFTILSLPIDFTDNSGLLHRLEIAPRASANNSYAALAASNFSFSIHSGNTNMISSNDDWASVPAVEGYFGQNLTGTHGVDPQTVLGTEFSGNTLPNGPRQVSANKGNPSAYNAGGLAEFDSGSYLAMGFQGNVQANPYLVFYLNTAGRSNVTFTYDVIDIDGGSNNAVSPIALQYRVGANGNFTNLPSGFIADATQGPNVSGLTTSKSVVLPTAAWNQSQVQVRLITTNAANSSGGSTPDEWIGVNNVSVTSLAPTSAPVSLGGRVIARGNVGLGNATVSLIDEFGVTRTATTNSFGYYRFSVGAAKTYVVSVRSRRYVYDTRVITVDADLADFDFYPLGAGQSILSSSVSTSRKGSIE